MKNKINTLPKGLKDVYLIANQCVIHLIKEGENPVEAEDMVLEILKECEGDLLNGNFKLVQLTLQTIFLK
jgi:hypothetical protein